jgi:hypothetical protein
MSHRDGRCVRLIVLAVGLAVCLQGVLPQRTQASPVGQGIAQTEEDAWRVAQEAEQRAAERQRAWPQAYPLPANPARPVPPGLQPARPAYPGSTWQQPYPWELLGSPYLPVVPLREVNFMGVQPTPDDPCYGRLQRLYSTPEAFRLNYLEAVPYLEQGYGPDVLDLWASYLSRPGTVPNEVQSPDTGVAMVGGCMQLPLIADDATLATTPEGSQRHECGDLARPTDATRLTARAIAAVIGGWLQQCGYLTLGLPPQLR